MYDSAHAFLQLAQQLFWRPSLEHARVQSRKGPFVTRDLSWHPHKYAPKHRSNALLWALTALLVAINIAVFVYHGDPRRLLPQKAPQAQAPAAVAPRSTLGVLGLVWDVLVRPARASEGPGRMALVGPHQPLDPLADLRSPGHVQRVEVVALRDRRTATHALADGGARPRDVKEAVYALSHAVDLHRLRPSDQFRLRFDGAGALLSVELVRGPTERIRADREDDRFVARRQTIEVETLVAEVVGEVTTNLWNSLLGAGEDPRLVTQLVDIFAYEIDFYSEVRPGDTFRLLIEKRYVRGQFIGYGDMVAAELTTGTYVHRAFLFKRDSRAEYFDESGAAMRKQLLRTPLQYGTVTSRFGTRKHPILGYTRAHNGVDYGVPIGTPVWSVGDGKVTKAHYENGFGQVVEITHPNDWISQYAHLSKMLVRQGQRVRQKEVVGLVGMTGLATGPHLHYGLKKRKHYVNSLEQRFERAQGLSGEQLVAYKKQVQERIADLGRIQVARRPEAAQPPPAKG